MRIRLSEVDRERYGLDEWTHFDAQRLTVREAALLQDIGYDTPYDWQDALNGTPIIENGQPVYMRDDDGEIVRDDAGQPVVKRRRDFLAWAALLWLVLHRRGLSIGFDDVDFDVRGFRWEPDPDPEADPGKGDTPEATSDTSETPTPPTS